MKTLRNLFAAALATAAIIFTVGCPGPSSTPDTPEEPVAAVTFSPNGGAVNSGSQVRLETATSDAEIYWAIDPANAITAENVKDMLSSMKSAANVTVSVKIEKACTIYAVAVRSSTGTTSEVTSATYTLAKTPGTVAFNPAAGTVASGTKVKLSATSAEGEESCAIYYSTSAALTAENYSTEGTAYDQAGDGIEITANTTIYAIAVGTSKNPGNPSSAAYTLPVTLMKAAPEADDVVYIYYPTGKNVMLTTADGSELKSATVTINDAGSFTTTDSMAALTVFKNEIGQYVFVSGGKYLRTNKTNNRNNLTLSDTFDVFALWEVEAISGGSDTFYIHSANSIFNNTLQGLEYYNSKFSAYDRKKQAIYHFQFYKDPSKSSELNAEAKAALALQANSLATPTFSIASTPEGQFTAPGVVTYLSSDSLDVEFYYTTDGSEITKENYATKASADPATAFKYDASQGIPINGNQNDTVTINAIAVKTVSEGGQTRGIFSLPASAVYKLGEDTNTYLSKVPTLQDGDVVAIYYPKGNTTISSATSGSGFSGTAATVSTKGLVLSDSLTQFTVKKLGESGYVFVNGGKYLSRTESNGLSLAAAFTDNSVWNLEKAGTSEDSFYIKNAGDSTRFIEFYNVFTVYTFQSSNTPIYTFQFYKNEKGSAESVTLSLLPVRFAIPGGTVQADQPIALISKSEGVNIYWKWKDDADGDLSSENYNSATKYDANTNEPKTKAGTLQAIAEKDGQFSAMTSVTYIIASGGSSDTVDFSTASLTDNTGKAITSGNNNDGYESITVATTASGTSVKFDKGSATAKSTYPKFSNSKDIRFMNGNTLTISNSNKKITNIEFTFGTNTTGEITADKGTYTSGETIWSGSENSVVFTKSGSGRYDIKSIKIFYEE